MNKSKTNTKEDAPEKQDFDWGEEVPEDEDYEEGEEDDYQEHLISIKLSAKNKTEEVGLDAHCALRIASIALAADNKSTSRHIIELVCGPRFEQRFVVARLIPNAVEAAALDLEIPPSGHQQSLAFVLTGDGELGDVDIVGTVMYMEEESEGEEREEEECSSCGEKHDDKGKEKDDDNEDIVKTLQEQRKKVMAMKEPTLEKKPAEKKEEVKMEKAPGALAINPFAAKPKPAEKPIEKPVEKKAVKPNQQPNIQKEQKKEEPKKEIKTALDITQPSGPQFRPLKGIQVADLQLGTTNQVAKQGDKVTVAYTLRLSNAHGRQVDQGKHFQFQLGRGQVISGWDIGVAGMKVGGKRALIIPPAYGYGKQGAGKDVPGNATLYFEVQLLGINGGNK